jgi:nucleoside-diphosphate kinase
MEKTFVMLKPSTVARGMIGTIVNRLENKGLKIVAMKLTWITQEKAGKLYTVHKTKPFYESLVKYMTSGPVVAMVVEGEDAVTVIRKVIGKTNPKEAEAGTIRGDFAMNTEKNAIHASDSVENAKIEMSIFFAPDEILTYKRADETWLY